MNNEEKILAILEKHGEMLARMDSRMERMEGRMDRIEGRMDRMEGDLSEVKGRLVNVELTQENVVLPQLQALSEGHTTILETLAPKNRVEALEEEMDFMKQVVRALSHEVEELKKAQ